MALKKSSMRGQSAVAAPPPPTSTVDQNIDTQNTSPPTYGGWDAEKAQVTNGAIGDPRKLNRIDVPRDKPAGPDDESGVSVGVGKQMELEASNAIKYRTCSWYKVSNIIHFSAPSSGLHFSMHPNCTSGEFTTSESQL